jgi:hypothetical protein
MIGERRNNVGRRGGETEMNGQEMHLGMIKMLSATLAFSVGISVTFGSMIVAVAAILQ